MIDHQPTATVTGAAPLHDHPSTATVTMLTSTDLAAFSEGSERDIRVPFVFIGGLDDARRALCCAGELGLGPLGVGAGADQAGQQRFLPLVVGPPRAAKSWVRF